MADPLIGGFCADFRILQHGAGRATAEIPGFVSVRLVGLSHNLADANIAVAKWRSKCHRIART